MMMMMMVMMMMMFFFFLSFLQAPSSNTRIPPEGRIINFQTTWKVWSKVGTDEVPLFCFVFFGELHHVSLALF
jgi:low affinity Fe/Cu permease